MKPEVIILGGGMAGCAAAYYLARQGVRAAVIEKGRIADPSGSSVGASRMYRQMYSNPYFCARSTEAIGLWRELEARHGATLLRDNGLLFYGESWEEETIEGSIPGAKRVMDERHIPYEHLTAQAIQARWPALPRPDFEGLFEPAAGMIWSERALSLFRSEAERAGASFFEGEGSARLEALPGGGARVQTGTGRTLVAERVVLACGAWTNERLAELGLQLDLELWPMLWAHYLVDPSLAAAYPQWFCFQRADAERGDGGLYYGFAAHEGAPRIKVGIDWCPEHLRTRDVASFRRDPDPKLVALLDRFLRSHWRGIGECLDLHVSPYTMTRDQYFILDRLPSHPGVTVFTGGSGHAFKFAPLIGMALAELALGKTPSFDLAPLSVTRPAAGLQRLSRGALETAVG